MANKPKDEAWVKKQVKDIFKRHNVWYFMPSVSRFGKAGVPDFVGCKRGLFISVETKCGNKRPTDLQQACMDSIQKAGGVTMVVNETNLELAENFIRDL